MFSEEISKNSSNSTVLNCYIGRAQAYLKLNKYKEALEDADKALALEVNDWRAYHKRGQALFHLKEYKTALSVLEEGQLKAESDTKKSLFNDWIEKCKAQLPDTESTPVVEEPVKPVAPPAVKQEWYQSESQVTISILSKNRSPNDVQVDSTENKVNFFTCWIFVVGVSMKFILLLVGG